MRLTIERMRTVVLGAGALLVIALLAFLAVARWKTRFILREIPQRLGANIQQEANGVTYTQAHGGHTLFKIHATKVVELKQGGRAILHDVQIELYGEDGARVDRISGDEFEYNQKDGIAKAAGPVEITLTRPGEDPALARRAAPARGARPGPLTNAAELASKGEIHVKTSGLTFDQKSGVATTPERVEFAITQGSGSSIGATFDSENGRLVLDQAVELNVNRGPERVVLRAHHAAFERDTLLCRMQGAEGIFRGGQATAGKADLLFRPDGSAVRLDASEGFSVTTPTAARIAAPRGTLEFDEHNQPRQGRLEGGTTLDSSRNGRRVHGSAPTADLDFTADGLLRHAHLERGVIFNSDETSESGRVSRDWRSPVADAEFRPAGKGQVELASINGTGGVVITSQTQRGGGPTVPSRMAADRVKATFGERQVLSTAVGVGHATMEQTTAAGATQTTSGDRIEAVMAPPDERSANDQNQGQSGAGTTGAEPIQSAIVEGNVVLVQQPAPAARKAGTADGDKAIAQQQAPLRATAGRAVYEGAGEWLHLLMKPRVENGALQLTADKVDVSQASGDAFAHGNVKASWMGAAPKPGTAAASGSAPAVALGGQGPGHVIAAEAQLHQATGEATFRGQVRLWQQANSISAPVIVLDKIRQTLVAHGTGAAEPVRVVMLSAEGTGMRKNERSGAPPDVAKTGKNEPSGSPTFATQDVAKMGHGNGGPSVIRVRGGDFKYSDAERKAVMHGGPAGNVVADTGTASIVSNDLELVLLPPGNHAGADGGAAQVDHVTASGHVTVSSQGRRGVGERLVYSGETGEYVLTGTPAHPPTLTDPAKGTVSGASLIFSSRDDRVSIEGGGGQKAVTETVAPR